MDNSEQFSPIRKGLLEFAVLKALNAREAYVADLLAELGKTPLSTQEGTLYPLLSKMRRDQLLTYEWRESTAGPPRKYYSLTHRGKEQLKEMEKYWQSIISSIKSLGK